MSMKKEPNEDKKLKYMNMKVCEIHKRKLEIETKIRNLIRDFSWETGLKVQDVEFDYRQDNYHKINLIIRDIL